MSMHKEDEGEFNKFQGAIIALEREVYDNLRASELLNPVKKIFVNSTQGVGLEEDFYSQTPASKENNSFEIADITKLPELLPKDQPAILFLDELTADYKQCIDLLSECYLPPFTFINGGEGRYEIYKILELLKMDAAVVVPGRPWKGSLEAAECFVEDVRNLTNGLLNTKLSELTTAWRGRYTTITRFETDFHDLYYDRWLAELDIGDRKIGYCTVLLTAEDSPPLFMVAEIYEKLAKLIGGDVKLLGNATSVGEQEPEMVLTLYISYEA